jgi:hypothetical protein
MKSRCYLRSCPAYEYYGARGIAVCEEWKTSFETFRDWAISNGYADGLELDRRDTNGHYEPGNCRWATRTQQMRNTRKRKNAKTSQFKGVHWNKAANKWRVLLHVDRKSIHIGHFADETEAAMAYDNAAIEVFGDFAFTNFSTKGGVPS